MPGILARLRAKGMRWSYVVTAALLGATVAGCGAGGPSSGAPANAGPPSVQASAALFAMLPPSIQNSKRINFGTDPTSGQPMGFYAQDGRTLTGVDPELAQVLAQVLGVTANLVPGQFNSLIPGIDSGRYDAGIAQIGDLKARQGQVDFVDYMKAGMALVVQKGNPKQITGVDGLCGHSVAVNTGTFEETTVNKQTKTCLSAGKPAITIQTFTTSASTQLALQSGRVDAVFADSGPMGYLVLNAPTQFEQVGTAQFIANVGIAVSKTNTRLRNALQAGLTQLISDGTYQSILAKWGQKDNGMSRVTINDASL